MALQYDETMVAEQPAPRRGEMPTEVIGGETGVSKNKAPRIGVYNRAYIPYRECRPLSGKSAGRTIRRIFGEC